MLLFIIFFSLFSEKGPRATKRGLLAKGDVCPLFNERASLEVQSRSERRKWCRHAAESFRSVNNHPKKSNKETSASGGQIYF